MQVEVSPLLDDLDDVPYGPFPAPADVGVSALLLGLPVAVETFRINYE